MAIYWMLCVSLPPTKKNRASADPTPQVLILSSHPRVSFAFIALQKGTTVEDGVFTPLVAYVMHLIVAGQPMNAQRAPKRTLGTLGLTPSGRILAQVRSLAHLALLRRAHANTENNAEFISGVRYALGALPQFELVVLVVICANSGCGAWKREKQSARTRRKGRDGSG